MLRDAAFLVQSRQSAILVAARSQWAPMMIRPQAEPAEARRTRRNVLTAKAGVMVPFKR